MPFLTLDPAKAHLDALRWRAQGKRLDRNATAQIHIRMDSALSRSGELVQPGPLRQRWIAPKTIRNLQAHISSGRRHAVFAPYPEPRSLRRRHGGWLSSDCGSTGARKC